MALIRCLECNTEISDKSAHYLNCGAPTQQNDDIDLRCIRCGTWLRQDYCPNCGYSSIKSKKMRRLML